MYYVRDASGSTLAIYKNSTLAELPIYGTSRLGVYYKTENRSVYQLTDHLGNVRAVITKAGDNAAISSSTDYYPFGMLMPGRQIVGGEQYRYSFQGQEKDPETGKEAFPLRLWDSRIGRWLTIDPKHEFTSPYLGMGNSPTRLIDPDGGNTAEPDGWYVDENGEIIGWDGKFDNNYYLVTNTSDINLITSNNQNGGYTSHSDLSQTAFLLPTYEMRLSLKGLFQSGKSDTSREYAGTIRGSVDNWMYLTGKKGDVFAPDMKSASSNALSMTDRSQMKKAYNLGINFNDVLYIAHTHNVVYPGHTFGGTPSNPSDYNYLTGNSLGIVLNTENNNIYIHSKTTWKITMKKDVFFSNFDYLNTRFVNDKQGGRYITSDIRN